MLLGFWALFSTVDLAGALIAFQLDKEDKRLIGWVLLQRIVYRQLMYYVIVKSLIVAIRGSLVGWGKFERKGTVQSPRIPMPIRPTARPIPVAKAPVAPPPAVAQSTSEPPSAGTSESPVIEITHFPIAPIETGLPNPNTSGE